MRIYAKYRDGIMHGKICHSNNEKQKTTNEGRNRTTKSRKKQNVRRNGNLQILEADTIKQAKMK